MQARPSRPVTAAGRDPHLDRGFTLVEVLVGMVVLAVALVGALGLAVQASRVTGQNLRRTTAAGLLTTQLEAARAGSPQAVPDGSTVRTVPVGGTTYTVTQVASYVSSSQTATICRSIGNEVVFKQVDVTVTWPAMQAVLPVRGSTLLAVGVGRDGAATSRGIVVVTVLSASGRAAAGAVVTLGDQSHLADGSGCVVFADLAPGSYSGSARGATGTADAGQLALVPATDLAAGYVRYLTIQLLPAGASPTGPAGGTGASTTAPAEDEDTSTSEPAPTGPEDEPSTDADDPTDGPAAEDSGDSGTDPGPGGGGQDPAPGPDTPGPFPTAPTTTTGPTTAPPSTDKQAS